MKAFKVGIDSYSLKPLGLTPFELLDWALINGADGVQFSEAPAEADDPGFLKELGQYARQNGLYLEWGGGSHIPRDLATGAPIDTAARNLKAAEQAAGLGIKTVRSCSGGLMRWNKTGPATETLLRETARSLSAQRPVFRDRGVTLAIETHFEFTTFELLRLFEMCEAAPGDGLGICLDTMNLLTLLEDPVEAARRILPYVVTTHIKDGGIALADERIRHLHGRGRAGRSSISTDIFDLLSPLQEDVRAVDRGPRRRFFDSDFRSRIPRGISRPDRGRARPSSPAGPRNPGSDEGRPAGDPRPGQMAGCLRRTGQARH